MTHYYLINYIFKIKFTCIKYGCFFKYFIDMKNRVARVLLIVISCVLNLYLYLINPLGKSYKIALVGLIFSLLLLPIGLVFRNDRRSYFKGFTVLVLIFVGIYFLLLSKY